MINKENLQLVIPMAGIGQRFIDAGYSIPKYLLEVDNAPIIKQIVDMFPGIDEKNIIFICNDEHIEKTDVLNILDKMYPKAKILSIPKHKKGPVYTINTIFQYINDDNPVIVSYCDCISYFNFDKWLESIGDFDGSLLANRGFHPQMLNDDNYAVCYKYYSSHNNCDVLKEIKEKEPLNDRFSEYISTGVHYFKNGKILKDCFSKLLQDNININGEYYVSLAFNYLQLKTNIFEVENVVNLGTPRDLEEYKKISNYFWQDKFNKLKFCHDANTTLILPMAGKGERFKKEYKEPKPLINIDGLPMFVNAVESAPKCNNKNFIVLREHVNTFGIHKEILNYYDNAKILILDKLTQGQAETIYLGVKDLNPEQSIFISACDYMIDYDADEYNKLIDDNSNDVIAFSFRNVQSSRLKPENYAWMELDKNNYLKKLYCKQFPFKNPSKEHVFMGTCFIRKAKYFLDAYDYNIKNDIRTNGEFYLDDLLNTCINQGLKVKIFENKHYIPLGTTQDLKVYNYWRNYFKKKFDL